MRRCSFRSNNNNIVRWSKRSWSCAAVTASVAFWNDPATAWTTTSSRTTNHSTAWSRMAAAASSSSATTTSCDAMTFEDSVTSRLENSWVRDLSLETPENLEKSKALAGIDATDNTNKTKRPVFNGHYVPVRPSGLQNPRLVLFSSDVAETLLGFTSEQIESKGFVNFVSGNLQLGDSWATPYALSIMGTRYTSNCPYGTGDGYGDGRAISIAELRGTSSSYELQLKGAGTTPFHRGADGRAVLRSSIREFLASEAMHWLGVETTRALSLTVSESMTTQRPWYAEADSSMNMFGAQQQRPTPAAPTMDDPRLSQYTDEQKRQIIRQFRNQKSDPNVMVAEKTAITCRVAPSFVRIGHLDLFARRAGKMHNNKSSLQYKELEKMVWHACYREYRSSAYDPYIDSNDIKSAATTFLDEAAVKIADMVANWVRIGFVQGNFNADNCLVSGRTMDYGPFGWVEMYDSLASKWTGSGEHFGFMNQPSAGLANYGVLVESVLPVLADDSTESKEMENELMQRALKTFQDAVDKVFRAKLGFADDQDVADDLWTSLERLFRLSAIDWTLWFRELTYLVRDDSSFFESENTDYEALLTKLIGSEGDSDGASPFYEKISPELRAEWLVWIESWKDALAASNDGRDVVVERMRTANPKYVLREWMLVGAYQTAAKGQEAELFSLHDLVKHPYEEGSATEQKKYYRRAPEEALAAGGTAFMS